MSVRISTEELARASGATFSIDSDQIAPALVKHRALIELRANWMLKAHPDADEITLDRGSLQKLSG